MLLDFVTKTNELNASSNSVLAQRRFRICLRVKLRNWRTDNYWASVGAAPKHSRYVALWQKSSSRYREGGSRPLSPVHLPLKSIRRDDVSMGLLPCIFYSLIEYA